MSDIEAMALRQRDEAVAANDRLKTDLALAQQKISQQDSRIETLQTERDHWMRFATALVEKLSVINMTIDDAMKSAKLAMFKPPSVVTPKPALQPMDLTDTNKLKGLVSRLNGGRDADTASKPGDHAGVRS